MSTMKKLDALIGHNDMIGSQKTVKPHIRIL